MGHDATMSADIANAQELRFERLLPAPVETVWAYLVDPDLRKLWFMGGATGSRAGEPIEMRFDDSTFSDVAVPTPERFAGYNGKSWAEKILRIEPPHLIAFTWSGGKAGTVTIELAAAEAGTRLVLHHTGLRGRDDAANFGGGWTSHLEVLRTRLEGGRVADFWAIHAAAEARIAAILAAEAARVA